MPTPRVSLSQPMAMPRLYGVCMEKVPRPCPTCVYPTAYSYIDMIRPAAVVLELER